MPGLWERFFNTPGNGKRFMESDTKESEQTSLRNKSDTSDTKNCEQLVANTDEPLPLENNDAVLMDSNINSKSDFKITYSDQMVIQAQTESQITSHYADFYENAPDMFFSIEARTARIIQCNQTMVDTLGYAKNELVGSLIFAFYQPDCMAKVRQAFRILCETGSVRNIELQVLCKDGTPIDVSLKASSVRNETGHVLYSHATWRDISDRKRAEAALRKAQNELNEITEADNRQLLEDNLRLQAEIDALKKSEQALISGSRSNQNLICLCQLYLYEFLTYGFSDSFYHPVQLFLSQVLDDKEVAVVVVNSVH